MTAWPSAPELAHIAFEASSRTEYRREVMQRVMRATRCEMALFADATDAVRAHHVAGLDPNDAEAARQTVIANPRALRRANERLYGVGVLVDTRIYAPREWRRLPHVDQHQVRMGITSNLILSWQRPYAAPTIFNLCRSGGLFSEADEAEALRHLKAIAVADAWHAPAPPAPALPDPVELSDRQREILACVRRGLTNKAIANACHISPFTVRNHLVKLFEHFGVSSRTELALVGTEGRPRRPTRSDRPG